MHLCRALLHQTFPTIQYKSLQHYLSLLLDHLGLKLKSLPTQTCLSNLFRTKPVGQKHCSTPSRTAQLSEQPPLPAQGTAADVRTDSHRMTNQSNICMVNRMIFCLPSQFFSSSFKVNPSWQLQLKEPTVFVQCCWQSLTSMCSHSSISVCWQYVVIACVWHSH